MSDNKLETARKRPAPRSAFKPGQCGNPGGRPKLPADIRLMKYETLETAIRILHEKIHDPVYIKKLKPFELNKFLETAFDRCGLPKVMKSEISGPDGAPIKTAGTSVDLSKLTDEQLKKLTE